MQLTSRNTCKRNSINLVEFLGKVFCAILKCNAPILQMRFEKLCLAFEGIGHALVNVDVLLQTVHNADEA